MSASDQMASSSRRVFTAWHISCFTHEMKISSRASRTELAECDQELLDALHKWFISLDRKNQRYVVRFSEAICERYQSGETAVADARMARVIARKDKYTSPEHYKKALLRAVS
jgi:hypothetical protein